MLAMKSTRANAATETDSLLVHSSQLSTLAKSTAYRCPVRLIGFACAAIILVLAGAFWPAVKQQGQHFTSTMWRTKKVMLEASRVVLYCSASDVVERDGSESATHLILSSVQLKQVDDSEALAYVNDIGAEEDHWDDAKHRIASLQKDGMQVLLMLAGDGDVYSLANLFGDFDAYFPALVSAIQSWGVDGIDIDSRNEYFDVNNDEIVTLLNRLREEFGDDFVLTRSMLAESLSQGQSIEEDHVNWINLHFYSEWSTWTIAYYVQFARYLGYAQDDIVTVMCFPQNVQDDAKDLGVSSLLDRYGSEFEGVGVYFQYWSLSTCCEHWMCNDGNMDTMSVCPDVQCAGCLG